MKIEEIKRELKSVYTKYENKIDIMILDILRCINDLEKEIKVLKNEKQDIIEYLENTYQLRFLNNYKNDEVYLAKYILDLLKEN